MKIIDKKELIRKDPLRITQLRIIAPLIAQKARPGQFVVVIPTATGERIPLTIVESDKETGTITLIFQHAGYSTGKLGELGIGETVFSLAGPLGTPTQIKKFGRILIIGGGVGIAEVYPVTRALKHIGNQITTIIGARSQDLFILRKELQGLSDEFFATTDDGSTGEKGLVTDVLLRLLEKNHNNTPYHLAYAVGPVAMMKKVTEITERYSLKTIVSLNALMVDATGMCGCCRVTVDKETKFACIDGPEFDAHLVDWDELFQRSKMYEKKEKHICNLQRIADSGKRIE
ncbi:MAG: sulfide/dihydroorotate dehydrogenase-like FAD/NAD-binding protein [Candidatus Omnitrophica bacterium]|nr:sulfide/dihydroorotate dehydrogenase-like FAD/NAD-binding protein [Candidatus Omnitrophota bacterium]